MGFLSRLAKQIVNKDDDEAAEVIRRATLPAPTRSVDTSGMPPPPAGNVIPFPPPTRAPINVGEPPPPADPYGLNAMENIVQNQPIPNLSNATVGPTGEIVGARYPTRAPSLPPPTRAAVPIEGMPDPPVTGPVTAPPMPRVMVGERYKGMSPTRKAQTRLGVLQGADPSSKVKDTGEGFEVLPPQRMGRAAGAGRGAIELMGAGAKHGLGGMLGAGLFGLGLGAIAPGRVQKMMRDREIGTAQQDYANNLGLDSAQLQNESRQLANMTGMARLEDADQDRALTMNREVRLEHQQGLSAIDEMLKRQSVLDPKSAEYASATAAIAQEAERLSKRTGRKVTVIPGNPKLNQLPRMEVDGQIIQQQHDGNWQPVYGSPKAATDDDNADLRANYEWQTKNVENEAKRTASIQESEALVAEAQNRQGKVSGLAGQISSLDAQMAKMSARDPALGPLKRQREQLKQAQAEEERKMGDAYRKAEEKKAEAAKFPTLPPPPKRARRASNKASGVSLSKSAWLSSHPGGNWAAAEAAAAQRQIPIIP